MFRSSLALALVLVSAGACAQGRFNLGRAPGAEEVAAWDIDVKPDGSGLPKGRGSVAAGEKPYDEKCASCHGSFGESNLYHILSGGRGSLATGTPVRSVGSKWPYAPTLFDYIRRAMPMNAPQSLATEELYSLTAYVLYLNDILPADATLDEKSLSAVRMPNRDGFVTDHGLSSPRGKPDTRNTVCMKDCVGEARVKSELPRHARGLHGEPVSREQAIAARRQARLASAGAGPTPDDIARKNACLSCHGVATRLIGPALRDIAARYRDERGIEDRLVAKVRAGGAGAWGAVPMPGNPDLSESEVKTLVRWILAGAPAK